MSTFIQQVVNGLGTGSVYALWAVGYGLVYQVLGLMHFAHGDSLLLGLYIMFSFLVTLTLPITLAVVLILFVGAAIALSVERIAYRPMVKRDAPIAAFIAALGAAYILRGIVTVAWGPEARVFPDIFPDSTFTVGDIRVALTPVLSLGIALAVIAAFSLFLRSTRQGQAITVVAQDRGTSSLMGIPVTSMVASIYALSGVIGMVGALMYVASFPTMRTTLGFMIMLKAYVAALIGGIGRLEGAIVGGLLFGLLEAFVVGYVSSLYSQAIVFGVLAAIVIVRPRGIFGRPEVTKL